MRCRQDKRTLPVTACTLEMVICLASAHAKARLSHVVEAEPDCKIAMDILSLPCSYHENTGATEPAVKENEPKEAVTLVEITDEGESC
jgi:DNA replication licensing factor MCM3